MFSQVGVAREEDDSDELCYVYSADASLTCLLMAYCPAFSAVEDENGSTGQDRQSQLNNPSISTRYRGREFAR
ncbi:hypothetical protein ACTXT7_014043 [Hymenolepis weldensis]